MIYKLLGGLIIGAAVAMAVLTLTQDESASENKSNKGWWATFVSPTVHDECRQLTPAEQLEALINQDFDELAAQGQLPTQWDSIATVEVRMNSDLAKALLGQRRPQIQRVQEGTAYLELEVMDLPDDDNPGIIIQASLFDIKSKNKIFEVGRTYTMNQLNKIMPKSPGVFQPNTKIEASSKPQKGD